MNRIITILVTIFILLLLYIWISHVWGSDQPRHPRQIVDAREGEVLGADDLSEDTVSTLLTDSEMENESPLINDEASEEMDNENEMPATNELVNSEPVKQAVQEEQKPVAPKTEPKPEPKKTETKAKTTSPVSSQATKTSQPITNPTPITASTEGKHLVIVGNFLQRVNATQRLQELKKVGFNDSEIVNFDLSEYHTVVAGRFDDVNEARRLAKRLKDYHKIDAYVRIGS